MTNQKSDAVGEHTPVSKHRDGWCSEPCPECRGAGRYWSDDGERELTCGRCGGTGERYEPSLDTRATGASVMGGLYESGWSPVGVKKAWERSSMDTASTARLLGRWHDSINAPMREAVAWLDEDDTLRRLVADYANGRRIDMSVNKRGAFTIRFQRHAEHTQ